MQTFIGIVTFGNLPFSKLTYQAILDTVKSPYKVCIVIGKPGDIETKKWASSLGLPHIVHEINYGFPYSINDLYDWGFGYWGYDAYIAIGNDVLAYPHAIDNMIKVAETTDYEWICAREISVKSLCKSNPEVQKYFSGDNYIFNDFTARPWDVFKGYGVNTTFDKGGLSDVHNLALYTKSAVDKLGYIDVNFYPAYYCLTPETLVLTDKLKWKPISDFNVGDKLVGVDEFPEKPRVSRSYRKAFIEAKRKLKADCLKITLSDGRSVTCSKNHKWLVKRPISECYFWRKADELYEGMRMCSPLSPWELETSFDTGWLSGIYDGEGSIKKPLDTLSFYQKKGYVLNKAISILDDMNIPYRCYDRKSSTASVVDIYGKDNILEMLGRLQPVRLVNKKTWDGARIRSKYARNVLSIIKIEPVGIKDVIDIQVSTRAFLANGIVSHNSDNDYARRGILTNVKSTTLDNTYYFHFWSRTIKQGSGGSTGDYFRNNRKYYKNKWGGDFGSEKFDIPFNGQPYLLGGVQMPPEVKISNRDYEQAAISHWKK